MRNMPIYRYECKVCGQQTEELRPIEQRDEPAVCPHCGGEAQRCFSRNFLLEIKDITGYSKITGNNFSEPVFLRRHRNWTPPADYAKKKMPPKIY